MDPACCSVGRCKSLVLGPALEKIFLARLTWAMHLTLNVEMDLRRLIPLVLYVLPAMTAMPSRPIPIVSAIVAGESLHEAFRTTGSFPPAVCRRT